MAERTLFETLTAHLQRDDVRDQQNVSQLAVAWARVSTDMQEERGISITAQFTEIRRYAEQQGYIIVAEYSETASAFQSESKRVEFHRMLREVKAQKEITAIIVHDFSRFSRDSDHARALVKELSSKGITVVSVSDPAFDDTTVAGVWLKSITFAKNEAYSREVAFHTLKGCKGNVRTRDTETGWCYKNGGSPLFGFKSVQLIRGEERKGHPIIKSIWLPNDMVVSGRTIAEWAVICLEMAAQGVSLRQLSEFCNENGIPGLRKPHWGESTWHAILQPATLMKYCGFEVYNVHRPDGSERPPSEWVVVENAHPALITEELASIIYRRRVARGVSGKRQLDYKSHSSRNSRFLLTGGLFTCAGCGGNMIHIGTKEHDYYRCSAYTKMEQGPICTSRPHIPMAKLDEAVTAGAIAVLRSLTEQQCVNEWNAILRQLWQDERGYDPEAAEELSVVERKRSNLLHALEDASDAEERQFIRQRLSQLKASAEALRERITVMPAPLQLSAGAAASFLNKVMEIFEGENTADQKEVIRECVHSVELRPDVVEIEVVYRIPEIVFMTDPQRSINDDTRLTVFHSLVPNMKIRWSPPNKGRHFQPSSE